MSIDLDFSTNNIWSMETPDGLVGIRFDSGDAGEIYLTKDQVRTLLSILSSYKDKD